MSTSIHTAADRKRDAAVAIRQLLAERDAKILDYRTRTYVDEPIAITSGTEIGDHNITITKVFVTMRSGKVFMNAENGGDWRQVGWPLPDTPAREDFDEIATMNRELRDLGYGEDED